MARRSGETLDEVHKKAPSARIYIVEYLALLGPDTVPGRDVPFNHEKVDYHYHVASDLQHVYSVAAAARSEWCELAPVHQISLGHTLGCPDPWVGGFDLLTAVRRGPILHPNIHGMKAVCDIL